MITVERRTQHSYGHTARAWWLSKDGVPVGYLKTLDNHYQEYPVVCDVEVRDGHRGNGYAGMLLRHAAKTVTSFLTIPAAVSKAVSSDQRRMCVAEVSLTEAVLLRIPHYCKFFLNYKGTLK